MTATSRRAFEALGSTCELLGVDVSEERLARGEAWIHEMHARLTRFEPESELSRLNAGTGRWTKVSAELEALLRESLRAYEVSDGLVHVGVLPRMMAIGYTRTFAQGATVFTPPRAEPVPPLPLMLEVRDTEARLAPGCGVDLGGIAKGWLADRLALDLGENVVVNLGGDLYARGPGPDSDGWPVGVGDTTVLLVDAGAATSGTGKRRWSDQLHHLIDPRDGLPARSDLAEVSVVAQTATDAEILAKTALLLGSARAEEFLSSRARGWRLA